MFEDELSKINWFDLEREITSVCDECSRPLAIYGYNQRLFYDGLIYNEFCDEHAEEFGVEPIPYFEKSKIKQKEVVIKPYDNNVESKVFTIQEIAHEMFESLASGLTEKEFLDEHPHFSRQDILACYEFAAQRI